MSVELNIGGYPFACVGLADADFREVAAIYAVICVSEDHSWTVLDVGQSGELRQRIDAHDRMQCWEEKCASKNIWVCIHRMLSSQYTKEERLKLENYLRQNLNPLCGSR